MKKLLFVLMIAIIWAIPVNGQQIVTPFHYQAKNITVSGSWVHPSAYDANDGELHVQAFNGSGNFAYYLHRSDGRLSVEVMGHFYLLSDGWHWFDVYDFSTFALDPYPGINLIEPTATIQLNTCEYIINQVSLKPKQ